MAPTSYFVLSTPFASRDSDWLAIEEVAGILRRGGTVAIPTETVYGLAANALDADAVARIYAAKGRPARNPLIVHVAEVAAAQGLVDVWPPAAQRLAAAFWPGPLTLVLPKRPIIPAIVTGGNSTVAIRCPAHPIAAAILRATGLPLAAPSANRSNHVSATTAQHVRDDLWDRIDAIVDGGPAWGGLESTVVTLATSPPRLLRSGPITRRELEVVLGQDLDVTELSSSPGTDRDSRASRLESPGMLRRHYAPDLPLEVTAHPHERIAYWLARGLRIGALASPEDQLVAASNLVVVELPWRPAEYAARLYDALRWLERQPLDRLIATQPPLDDAWHAVHDRLRRAAELG